ncbi:hypothetical protein EVAR_68542_1 [Eumeta japonica]|uniref:Uncharacterized protein n=1 Tax=Eumeta variegata TaxID=151549 RepID=A0A4C1ZRB7_EUMVA|nr:hypothetical protein EVAR_68542_1 [Eumeta japonica]
MTENRSIELMYAAEESAKAALKNLRPETMAFQPNRLMPLSAGRVAGVFVLVSWQILILRIVVVGPRKHSRSEGDDPRRERPAAEEVRASRTTRRGVSQVSRSETDSHVRPYARAFFVRSPISKPPRRRPGPTSIPRRHFKTSYAIVNPLA